jgi:hypothetical protein
MGIAGVALLYPGVGRDCIRQKSPRLGDIPSVKGKLNLADSIEGPRKCVPFSLCNGERVKKGQAK